MSIIEGHAGVPAWTRKVNDNDPIGMELALPVGGIEQKWRAKGSRSANHSGAHVNQR
jgi:hypothetical protein